MIPRSLLSPGRQSLHAPRLLSPQKGVGLIEIMVAVLVLSIAFLGIAALLANSLKANNGAMSRSMSTIASYSIIDAMRADLGGAKAGQYNTTFTADQCPPVGAGSLSAWQLHQWCTQLGEKLGAVKTTKGSVACSATGDCTVTVQFDDSHSGKGSSTAQAFVTRAIL